MENRRKFAPHMVARKDRPPLHRMLLVVAIANIIIGTLRAGFFFIQFLSLLGGIRAMDEALNQQSTAGMALSLAVTFVMLVLNISVISGGAGLLQYQEWGRTATYVGTLIGMILQLTGICVTMMLALGPSLARAMGPWLLFLLLLSILYDALVAATISVPSVVEDLED
jgi:hypothetical protein